MAEAAEVQKGDPQQPGAAEQLPQGAAGQLNETLAAAPEQAGPEVPVPDEQLPVEFAEDAEDGTEGFSPMGEIEEILFADPENPTPVKALRQPPQRRVPAQVVRYLPAMRAMLEDPSAPASLRAVYRAIVDRLIQEQGI